MLNHVYSSLSCRVQQVEVCAWNSTEEVGTEMRFDFHAMLWFHWRNFTPWKINMEHVLMEVWFRSFSFLNGWFVCSMLIFRGVALILLGSITTVRPQKWGFSPKERCLSSNHQFFLGELLNLGGFGWSISDLKNDVDKRLSMCWEFSSLNCKKQRNVTHQQTTSWWQLKHFLFSSRTLRKWSYLTLYTNAYFSDGLNPQPPTRTTRHFLVDSTDLSPSTHLTNRSDRRSPRMIDFGLAHSIDECLGSFRHS